MREPVWHTMLEVMGGVLSALTIIGLVGAWLIRTRRIHVVEPRERRQAELEERWARQLAEVKKMLGINGKTIVEQLDEHMDNIAREAEIRDRALHRRLDAMAVDEMLHRQQGYAIARMQHDAAQQAGIKGWPDPKDFRGMLGLHDDDTTQGDDDQ